MAHSLTSSATDPVGNKHLAKLWRLSRSKKGWEEPGLGEEVGSGSREQVVSSTKQAARDKEQIAIRLPATCC